MSANSTSIYTGPWVNWEKELLHGSTVTLSARNSAILTSFLATFITIVGTQLWKILCFLFHQSRVSQEPKDGLYHQHQNVLRNSSTPGGAAWSFMLQSWYWRGRGRNSTMRSLFKAFFSTAYIIIFIILSIIGTSEVSKAAGSDRLIRGSQCGYWRMHDTDIGQSSFEAKLLRDTQAAAAYDRDCYDEPFNSLKCNTYATPFIKWKGDHASCPFKDGICYRNYVYRMDTGLIDSRQDLGINTPSDQRIKYRRVTTCSVLNDEGYKKTDNATQLSMWYFGPFDRARQNYTFSYNSRSLYLGGGYSVL